MNNAAIFPEEEIALLPVQDIPHLFGEWLHRKGFLNEINKLPQNSIMGHYIIRIIRHDDHFQL